jgi:Uma2 family endonuclease
VTVVCDQPRFADDEKDVLLNPLLIVEVLSDSTEKYDRRKKFLFYQEIESFREYLLVDQNSSID